MAIDRQAKDHQGEEEGSEAAMRSLHDIDRPALAPGMTVLRKMPHQSADLSLTLRRIPMDLFILANGTGDIQDETWGTAACAV